MATPTQQEHWGGGGGGGRGGGGRGRGGSGRGGGRGGHHKPGERQPGQAPTLNTLPRPPGTVEPAVPGKLIEYPNGKVINPVTKNPVSLINELIPSLRYQQEQYGSR